MTVSAVEAIEIEFRKLEFVLKILSVLPALKRISDDESKVLFNMNSPSEKSLIEENKDA